MNDPRERDDIFRNRITEALRWADRQSDEAIEKELAEVEAAPLREEEVSRILAKTSEMRATQDSAQRSGIVTRSVSEEPDPHSEALPHTAASLTRRVGISATDSTGHGDADMKKSAQLTRPVAGHSKASGSSSIVAIVASCACLLAAMGLFQVTGVDDEETSPGGRVASTDITFPPDVDAFAEVEPFYTKPTLLRAQPREAVPIERVKVGDVIETGERERRRLTLPDGSILFVNQQTVAKVETPRRVRVDSGEVYVEVVPENLLTGELRTKFVVEAPDRSVTALGTKFAVKTAPKHETEVLVTQGEVAATGLADSLEAGRELTASYDGPSGPSPSTESEELTVPDAGTARKGHPTEGAEGTLVVQQAPRASEALSWTRELVAAAETSLIPLNRHRGGSLIVVDSQGQEMRLSLRKFHVDVHIEDGFARTTIDQTYFNHTRSRQEGTFHFPLPPDASLSRLAMYVNGKLMEGGMAERDHARNTFEEIVRSMKDPALLEWVDGSTFKMRVFPLEPRQEKRIVMSYSQRLSNDYGKEVYRFPAGHNLDRVRDWSANVRVAGGENLEWDSPSHFLKASKPDGDLVLEGEAHRVTMDTDLVVELADPVQRRAKSSTRFSSAQHEGQQYFMVRFRPDFGARTTGPPKGDGGRPKRNWIFLYESSGDRNPILARVQVDVIRTFLDNAEHDDTFSIVRASSKSEAIGKRPVPCVKKHVTKAIDFMEDSHLLGALDLKQAFKLCARLKSKDAENWLVHVGSGIPAIGERDATTLERLLPKQTRYVGVGVGKRWNRTFMKSAAGRTGGHFAQINPDEKITWRAFELFSTLNAPRLLDVKVASADDKEGDGELQYKFLNFADTLAHGQELCAVTRLSNEDELPKSLIVTGLLDGKEFKQTVKVKKIAKNADYLPRSWSRLEIDRLVALGANENKATIISLSKAMYVMSPFTSLLVLENEAMYKQYNIDRGRKDHWALYGAPPQIKVVHEPLMGPQPNASPDELRRLLRAARAESDEATSNLDLARRDERDEKIIDDLSDQVEVREAQVEVLYRRMEQLDRTESDELTKVADTVVWRRQQPTAQQFAISNYDGPRIPTYESLGFSGPQRSYERDFGLSRDVRRQALLNMLNSRRSRKDLSDLALEERIASYELAYRMQTVPAYNLPMSEAARRPDGRRLSELDRLVWTSGFNQHWGIITNGRMLEESELLSKSGNVRHLFEFIPARRFARPELRGTTVLKGTPAGWRYLQPGGFVPNDQYFLNVFGAPERTFFNRLDDDGDGRNSILWGGRHSILTSADDGTNTLWMAENPALFNLNIHGNLSNGRALPIIDGFNSHRQLVTEWLPNVPLYTVPVGDFDIDVVDEIFRESVFTMPLPYRVSGRWGRVPVLATHPRIKELLEPEIRGDTSIEAMEELGALVITGNSADIDGLMTVIQQIEKLDESQLETPEAVRLVLTPQQSEIAAIRLRTDVDQQLQEVLRGIDLSVETEDVNLSIRHIPSLSVLKADAGAMMLVDLPKILGTRVPVGSPYFILPPGILPELMPGLQTLPADQLVVLEAEGGEKVKVRRGSVDEKARRLIERTRQTGWQKVALKSLSDNDEPVYVSIKADGKFRYDRTLPHGIRETVLCDGDSLWHIYAELGIASKRPMSRFHRDAMNSRFPWAVASAEDLSIGFDVRFVNENTIELVPLKPEKKKYDGPSGPSDAQGTARKGHPTGDAQGSKKARRKTLILQLVFGKDGRLAEKRLVAGKKRELVLRTVFKADGTVRVLDSDKKELMSWKIDRSTSEPVNITPETSELVVLPLPYRSVAHVQPLLKRDNAFTTMSEDDALKVLAAWFAAGDFGSVSNLIHDRYTARNDHRLGFLTLVSVSTPVTEKAQTTLDRGSKNPVAVFLKQYWQWRNTGSLNEEMTFSGKQPEFIQNFVKAHNLFALWHSGRATNNRTSRQIKTEVTRALHTIRECPLPAFRWKLLATVQHQLVASKHVGGELGRMPADELQRFEKLPGWKGQARYRRLVWLLQARKTKDVGQLFHKLLVDAAETGAPIILTAELHELFKQRLKGHREWTSAVNAVAKILKKDRGAASLMDLAEQCRALEEEELAESFFAEVLIDVKIEDDWRLLPRAYNYVRQAEDWDKAEEYLQLILRDKELAKQSSLWREAAAVSVGLGDGNEALRRLEHALNIEFQHLPKTVDLQPFRTTYGELFDQFAALAEARLTAEEDLPKDFLDRLLAMADRWRTIDPDDTDVCQRVARIAARLGKDDLAWGYLTTPLAENPGDSGAWRNLAKEMGAQSSTRLASRAFDQAFEIESTNPEILFEHATMLREAGQEAEAKKLFRRVVDEKWQRRFNGVISNARQALQAP